MLLSKENWRGVAIGAVLSTALYFVINPWVPFWSVEPEFQPGSVAATSPFDVPFVIRNRSTLVSINRLEIKCMLVEIVAQTGEKMTGFAIQATSNGSDKLGPLATDFYVCPFTQLFGRTLPGGGLKSAKIRFVYSYYPDGRSDNAPSSGSTAVFTAVGSPLLQWMEGTGIQ